MVSCTNISAATASYCSLVLIGCMEWMFDMNSSLRCHVAHLCEEAARRVCLYAYTRRYHCAYTITSIYLPYC